MNLRSQTFRKTSAAFTLTVATGGTSPSGSGIVQSPKLRRQRRCRVSWVSSRSHSSTATGSLRTPDSAAHSGSSHESAPQRGRPDGGVGRW
ncbi:hypothetical protein RM704_38890 [Streptomyces sp. DSM 3412]|uniref:Uncharacterized protein n=1 Tax=Streptomyces gottesmaniae TaxID=3075518 RepID=A0ABU2Z9T6_9ACTN|nr:hypothetical protein [Streptomyces sp. DSM 3412]MDT0573358.1 hypothetical protein [Streptomyces sp. DSM 3412]